MKYKKNKRRTDMLKIEKLAPSLVSLDETNRIEIRQKLTINAISWILFALKFFFYFE